MDMIVPEMIFISGDKGAVAQTGKGDPEAFRKLLCETASQIIPESQKELKADCEELVEFAVHSAWIEIPHVLPKEVMDEDVSFEDAGDFQNTGGVGVPLVITAELPVEKAETQLGVGKTSAIVLSEMAEPEIYAKGSALAGEVRVDDDSLLSIKVKAKTGESEPLPMKLFREEERVTGMTSAGDRNAHFKEFTFIPAEKPLVGEVIVAQDESEDQSLSFVKVAEPFTEKPDATQDELKRFTLRQDHSATGVHTEIQSFVGSENELKVANVTAVWESRVIDPIIKEIQFQRTFDKGLDEVRVRLQPESLGEVVIKISRVDGQIRGRILVENVMVKEVLENRLPMFRERLSNVGIELSELHVSLGSAPDKESGTGLPARKNVTFRGHGGKGLDPVVSESPTCMQGGLNVLV